MQALQFISQFHLYYVKKEQSDCRNWKLCSPLSILLSVSAPTDFDPVIRYQFRSLLLFIAIIIISRSSSNNSGSVIIRE